MHPAECDEQRCGISVPRPWMIRPQAVDGPDEERDVSRHGGLLTHTYPITLMAEYQAEFKAAGHKSVPVTKAEAPRSTSSVRTWPPGMRLWVSAP